MTRGIFYVIRQSNDIGLCDFSQPCSPNSEMLTPPASSASASPMLRPGMEQRTMPPGTSMAAPPLQPSPPSTTGIWKPYEADQSEITRPCSPMTVISQGQLDLEYPNVHGAYFDSLGVAPCQAYQDMSVSPHFAPRPFAPQHLHPHPADGLSPMIGRFPQYHSNGIPAQNHVQAVSSTMHAIPLQTTIAPLPPVGSVSALSMHAVTPVSMDGLPSLTLCSQMQHELERLNDPARHQNNNNNNNTNKKPRKKAQNKSAVKKPKQARRSKQSTKTAGRPKPQSIVAPDPNVEPLTLSDTASDEERFLLSERLRHTESRGKGMWEIVRNLYNGRWKTTYDTAALQMRNSRAIQRHGIWPAHEEVALFQAFEEVNATFLSTVMAKMKEYGGCRSWDWKPRHLEAKLVMMGLIEPEMEKKNKDDRRRRNFQRKQARAISDAESMALASAGLSPHPLHPSYQLPLPEYCFGCNPDMIPAPQFTYEEKAAIHAQIDDRHDELELQELMSEMQVDNIKMEGPDQTNGTS